MAAEECFDLTGLDALPAAPNDVPLPSDDDQISRGVVAAQVSRAKPSVWGPHVAGSRIVVEIPGGAAGPPSPDLAGFARGNFVPRVVHQAKLGVPPRSAHGVKTNLRRVLGTRRRPAPEVHGPVPGEDDARGAALDPRCSGRRKPRPGRVPDSHPVDVRSGPAGVLQQGHDLRRNAADDRRANAGQDLEHQARLELVDQVHSRADGGSGEERDDARADTLAERSDDILLAQVEQLDLRPGALEPGGNPESGELRNSRAAGGGKDDHRIVWRRLGQRRSRWPTPEPNELVQRYSGSGGCVTEDNQVRRSAKVR